MSADGTDGAGITDRDRETARRLAGDHESWCHADVHGNCCDGDCDCGRDERAQAIAAGLADERRRVLAPMLTLAERWAQEQRAHTDYWVRGDAAANAIRYAAEQTQ